MVRYIAIIGGVMSGVGKGVAAASIGKIMQQHGFSVTAIKIDPYINFDAGTMRPTEHGEVWVTNDGGEIDQDLGNYERFLGEELPKRNNITTGQIYGAIIDKERRGDFLGQTVQFIPHIPGEVKRRIEEAAEGYDICIVEVGGTVGDYENIPFLIALKNLEMELGSENVLYGLITYLPVPGHIEEMKTKPTQTAIRLLTQHGIIPDFILCRGKKPLDDVRRKKIELYANIKSGYVISAPDIDSLYYVPLNFEIENLGLKLLKKFGIESKENVSWDAWKKLVDNIKNPRQEINVAMVGKYLDIGDYTLKDVYISINEALEHAGANLGAKVNISWIDSKKFETDKASLEVLRNFDGIIIPGGFGGSGVEGKIEAIRFARENDIPFLGLCYGMQLAIVEYARNVCGLEGANTTEVDPDTKFPVISLLPEQENVKQMGGSMRLGEYAAVLGESKVLDLYRKTGRLDGDEKRVKELIEEKSFRVGLVNQFYNVVLERHRHRYEVTPFYVETLEKAGLLFPGKHLRRDGTKLMEFIELPKNKFFCATQAHPEFKSKLDNPAPLFLGFVSACVN